mmetsp:Transcript_2817/g.5504  ORF Transcript_2817/g.5504 Transcript_2817/m.5504 type:complete len:415 (-) Transcript_2817:472-1716(-)
MSSTLKSTAKIAQMSPSERAKADAARYEARKAKAKKAPGPGAYEPRRGLGNTAKNEPTASFKSQTTRSQACTLLHGSDLAASSTSTQAEAGNQSPGPGKYTVRSTDVSDSRPSSAFASRSARCFVTPTTFPGVGTYSPERSSLSKRCSNANAQKAAFSSSSPRFESHAVDETAANLGPGSYTPENGIGSHAGASGAQSSRSRASSAPLGSSSSRGLANSAASDRRDQLAMTLTRSQSASACSGRASTARETTSCSTCTPSAAHSSGVGSSALTTSRSFSRCAQAGSCAFGATAPRGGATGGSSYPGPGQYSPSSSSVSALKQSSAFASNSTRCAPTANLSPGVGTYSPRQSSLSSKSAADTAFRSTEARFKEHTGRTGEVGPGSYGQVHATMEKELNAGAGQMSAAFASTTLRD